MRLSSDPRASLNCSARPRRIAGPFMLLMILATTVLTPGGSATAQSGSWAVGPSSLCTRDNALEIIRQQIDAAKSFNDTVQRIAVMIRAADLLWPYQQVKARATFDEAFNLATQDFKEKGDEPRKVGRALLAETPDQRYVVIRAIARRDPAWARNLTDEMLKKERQEAEE